MKRSMSNEDALAGTWWRHDDVTWHFWKIHFPKCYIHETWSVGTRWKKYSNDHALAGTWWRHDDVTWHFWKTYFLKSYEHETWSVCTRSKENVNEHFPKCYKYETWSVWTRWKEMLMSIRWQVPDDVMMTSHDFSEKHEWACASRYLMTSWWGHVTFWKRHFPNSWKHETWSVSTK